MHTHACRIVRVVIRLFIAQTRCLLLVVDLVAGVPTIRSVFTYAYILILMSMDCCDVVNELVDEDLTVSHGCNVSMLIAYIDMCCARYSC